MLGPRVVPCLQELKVLPVGHEHGTAGKRSHSDLLRVSKLIVEAEGAILALQPAPWKGK